MEAKEIVKAVERYYAIDVKRRGRKHRYSHPRQVAMYILRQKTHMSYLQISRYLGLSHHTTAIYGIKKVKETYHLRKDAKEILKQLEDL